MNDADSPWDFILNSGVTPLFGLKAQGHIPTVERMVAEGKSWKEIGNAIGWAADAVEKHWGWYCQENEAKS